MPDDPKSQSSQILVRKLSKTISADVAELSRLMGEDEEQTLKTFRGHKKVFAALAATHRGRIFNTAGDAILAEFASDAAAGDLPLSVCWHGCLFIEAHPND